MSAGRRGDTPDSVHRCVTGRDLGKHRSIQVELLIDRYLYVNIIINIYRGFAIYKGFPHNSLSHLILITLQSKEDFIPIFQMKKYMTQRLSELHYGVHSHSL